MIQNSSFRLANALLGLLVIILSFLGLPDVYKTVLLVIFGLLIILFSLAEVGRREVSQPGSVLAGRDNSNGVAENVRETENHTTG